MKLKELLKIINLDTNEDIEIKGITCNSREVKKGYLFIATKGNRCDGNDYIDNAFNSKASYVISDSINKDKVLKVENIKQLKAKLFYHFYGYPQDKLKIIGVTLTNVKTSCAYII